MSDCKDALVLFLKLMGVGLVALALVSTMIFGGLYFIKFILYLVGLIT